VNFFRALRLVGTHNKQYFLRLRHDLGRELVVLISSLVLLGLFAYIFRDFLNEKLKVIPAEQQAGIARLFAFSLLMVLGPWIASPIRKLWRQEPSLRSFALRSGENPSTVRLYLIVQTSLIVLLSYTFYWRYVGLPWGRWSLAGSLTWLSLSLALGLMRLAFFGEAKSRDDTFRPLLDDGESTRLQTIRLWRTRQIYLRNRLAKLCLALALLVQVASGLLLAQGAPLALAILLAMVTGLLTAAAPSFQLEEDMRAIWFERQIACSHDEYLSAYQAISVRLALLVAIATIVAAFLGRGTELPFDSLKVAAVASLFPLMFPAVMFQIAPERSILQIMTIALIGLFLGTAIFAHWASIILVPIAVTYAKQYQKNNFYRS
jgi:hypothetical protein